MSRFLWKKKVLACLVTLTFVSGCVNPFSSLSSDKPVYTIEQLDPRIAEVNRQFSFSLYRQIAMHRDQDSNLLVSPVSIAMALTAAYNGAEGKTKEAMENALALNGLPLQEVNKGNEVLLDLLTHSGDGSMLSIANSMWIQEGAKINEAFVQQARIHYKSEVEALHFTKANAPKTINAWVEKHTGGKIKNMVEPPLNPQTLLMLINAVYFKGNWSRPFDPASTVNGDFHLPDGTIRSVPLMTQSGSYEYVETDAYQAIRLPYTGKQQNLLIFLPKGNITLARLQDSLFSQLDAWNKTFPVKTGVIRLPRFQIQDQLKLNDALKALGMSEAFDPVQANFSGITPSPNKLYIEGVMHKTYIDINEKGTEAAAATSLQMAGASAPVSPFQMTVDRPFFFAIEDRATGVLLFMGSVYLPSSSS